MPFSSLNMPSVGSLNCVERSFVEGETLWMEAQGHIGENIGRTNTHVLLVELIEPRAAKNRQ